MQYLRCTRTKVEGLILLRYNGVVTNDEQANKVGEQLREDLGMAVILLRCDRDDIDIVDLSGSDAWMNSEKEE